MRSLPSKASASRSEPPGRLLLDEEEFTMGITRTSNAGSVKMKSASCSNVTPGSPASSRKRNRMEGRVGNAFPLGKKDRKRFCVVLSWFSSAKGLGDIFLVAPLSPPGFRRQKKLS